ncbi:PigN-domain-containing protein [Pluteus cervinus]|uniref:PigN-domain-containing protein n=1 Tax=Pluteus cervinus TaxID=181527 RepID=A0ACD3A5T1_9AGAR|nr:PigN-domain-containing protein [Pluteus cervinus]
MATGKKYSISALLLVGFVFHLVYIGSVFDCYFTSPVVQGMKSYNTSSAQAKRLVLFVGDGLRADLLFNINPFPSISNSTETAAPHLRRLAEYRGAFGVSHTRVPTESRPGHVAIIGGMYEDVSAVTKGWKTNPVDFDSVFNQSSSTFSFGSPDILPMFAQGATPGKVKTWSYDEHEEDFTKESTLLDIWVFDQLKTLFNNATTDSSLNSELRAPRVIFFLHLLGLDMAGHSYRPHSAEYMKNIQAVDDIVRRTEGLMTDFFGDEDTSYIFTADHGMSVVGNHGDGHPDNTRTPLIAWGKGIRGPEPDSESSSHDAYSEPWKLGHLLRRDVEQADIACLMATLLGINWPVNGVGVLPDVDPTRPGYLSAVDGGASSARAALVNARVIIEHYARKHELKKTHTLFYKPFELLEDGLNEEIPYRTAELEKIEQLIANGDWYAARQTSADLIQAGLQGLHYLQTYDRTFIRLVVVVAYTGWAAYCSLYIFRPLENAKQSVNHSLLTVIFSLLLLGSWAAFAIQRSPWTFYLYTTFPCYFWHQVLVEGSVGITSAQLGYGNITKNVLRAIPVLGILQAMVAGYTHRSLWGAGYLIIGLIWPLTWASEERTVVKRHLGLWLLICSASSVFPLLPVDKKESIRAIIASGVSILAIGYLNAQHLLSKPGMRVLFTVQAILIFLTMVITESSVAHLQAKVGLPVFNQISGWILLVTSSILPFIYPIKHTTIESKLLMFFMGFGPCFVILSISVEGLFYTAYFVTLVTWIDLEVALRTHRKKIALVADAYRIQSDDLRIALFFLFFVQVGFFGTGNVASISSFYLEPVYRLIPIFNPFFMSMLLVFKIVAPYIMLSVTFTALNHRLNLPPFSLFLVAMALTDGMTLTFFFNVTDTGSWLEIGQSISFFCITSLLLLWSAGIYVVGEYLMSDVVAKPTLKKVKST